MEGIEKKLEELQTKVETILKEFKSERMGKGDAARLVVNLREEIANILGKLEIQMIS